MKTTLLLLLAVLSLNINAIAQSQCNVAIPSNAIVVNSTDTINGGFEYIWVCSGDTLVSDGGIHHIFLEPGAHMKTGGGIDTIHIKAGATFFMNGGIHTIYYEDTTSLLSIGGIPTLDSCEEIIFDYTNAPINGCAVLPTAAFSSSDSAFCANTCIDFTNLSADATSWQWTFEGGTPSTSTDETPQDICYNTAGVYGVTLVASNGSGTDTFVSNTLIIVYPTPAAPTIIESNDTLFATQGYASYEWYFTDTIELADSTYFIVPTQEGEYTVEVTDSNGCENEATIDYVNTGITLNLSLYQIDIYPNPSSGEFTIASPKSLRNAQIEIYNVLGEKIYSDKFENQSSGSIDLNVASGIYFVRLTNGVEYFTKKLTIE